MIVIIIVINLFFSFVNCMDGFDRNCLDSHNAFRKKHTSPPMKWSESLAAAAQTWADKLAREDKFEHDTKTITAQNQGENLAFFSPPRKKCLGAKDADCVQCSEMVTDWYNEVDDYDYSTGKAKIQGKVYLHFTQVVWKSSVELGVGVGISKKYGFITVARYGPRGNMGNAEEFKKNVLPGGTVTAPAGTATPTASSTKESTSAPVVGSTTIKKPGEATTPAATATPTTSITTGTKKPDTSTTTKQPEGGDNCEYFVITTITKQHKIIQKCKGKPNITFIPSPPDQATPQKPQSTSTPPSTAKPSTNSPTTSQTNAPSKQPSSEGSTALPTTNPTGGSTGPQSTIPSGSSSSPSSTGPPGTTNPTTGGSSTGPTNKPTLNPKEEKDQHDKSIMLINIYRVMHTAAPLFWNEELAKEAQSWADKLAQSGKLNHDTSMKDGENIAQLPASNRDVINAVDAWYDEEKLFDYKTPAFNKATGHFTQLVWKGSKEMGLGIAPSKDKSEYYIVARFRPAGNVQGKFDVNVGSKIKM